MGVKDLWNILTPICERKPIWELQDKTIAIDLSAWICDSSTVAEHCSQKNMYLRNLFFRTSYLLLLGVKPIFVLEGKAPVLKHDTIEKRQQAQGKSAGRNVKAGSRARLKGLQTQCAALLTAMGLKCIQGDGEAEAFCALLNQAGLVDGVVTQDSDVFLYGGVKVYRHFNTSCAGGGSVDTYEMKEIESRLGLGRNKLIALSLLCGCDYNKGVAGVGKESALKFFQSVEDDEILDRIQNWRQNTDLDYINVKKDKSISPELKCELQIRAKALQDEEFPCQEVLEEFLQINSKELPRVRFQWSRPNLNQFLKLTDVKLAWDSTYALEKSLPLLTRWHLIHNDPSLVPETILNAKTTRGIKCYVIKWREFEVTTEEPQALFEQRWPEMVQAFVDSKTKGKKKATKKNKENENPATSKAKSKTSPEKEIESTGDALREVNLEPNADTNTGQSTQNSDNKEKSSKKPIKPERKKKETQRKTDKTEEAKKKVDRKPRKKSPAKGKGDVDIRNYFKNNVEDKTKLTDVLHDIIDESINLLNSSMGSLSIAKTPTRHKEEFCIKDLDMSSIIEDSQDTNRLRRDTNAILGDVMEYRQDTNRVSRDTILGDKVDLMDESLAIDVNDDINRMKSDGRINYDASIHIENEDDILDFSFNTACRIMSQKEINRKTERDYNEDITKSDGKKTDIHKNYRPSKYEDIKNSDERNEDNQSYRGSDKYKRYCTNGVDMNGSLNVEHAVGKAYNVDSLVENMSMNVSSGNLKESTRFTGALPEDNMSCVNAEDSICLTDRMPDNMSVNVSCVILDDSIRLTEKISENLSVNSPNINYGSVVNLDDSLPPTDTIPSKVPLTGTIPSYVNTPSVHNPLGDLLYSTADILDSASSQISNKLTQTFETDNIFSSMHDHVTFVDDGIESMSFQEYASPLRYANLARQSPEKLFQSPSDIFQAPSEKLFRNLSPSEKLFQNRNPSDGPFKTHKQPVAAPLSEKFFKGEKSSERSKNTHHPSDIQDFQSSYGQFSQSNSAWRTSSPMLRHSAVQVSTNQNKCGGSSKPRGVGPDQPNIGSNRPIVPSSILDINSPLESSDLSSPPRVKIPGNTSTSRVNLSLHRFHKVRAFDESSPLRRRIQGGGVTRGDLQCGLEEESSIQDGLSFDMGDFEFNEENEDLSGIIENIVSQR